MGRGDDHRVHVRFFDQLFAAAITGIFPRKQLSHFFQLDLVRIGNGGDDGVRDVARMEKPEMNDTHVSRANDPYLYGFIHSSPLSP